MIPLLSDNVEEECSEIILREGMLGEMKGIRLEADVSYTDFMAVLLDLLEVLR